MHIMTKVINNAANEAYIASLGGDVPEIGNRRSEVWSCCFQGGTFDRIKQRCMSLCMYVHSSHTMTLHDCPSLHIYIYIYIAWCSRFRIVRSAFH